ncbi:hypothetical protein CEXT_772541 [Caerostris extrusa]|uniref:Uncharacterized protein n=1 Tax=Caerostris extrusa TaxID=172846 RepID=A0AAV4NT66_CAEEX|nr:hypothetical protein CEXT_772541 [Caerostris extrusa]
MAANEMAIDSSTWESHIGKVESHAICRGQWHGARLMEWFGFELKLPMSELISVQQLSRWKACDGVRLGRNDSQVFLSLFMCVITIIASTTDYTK